MNYKQLSDNMTENAFRVVIEIAPTGEGQRLGDIAESIGLGTCEAEFILQQMIEAGIASKNGWGRYTLTPEYRAARRC